MQTDWRPSPGVGGLTARIHRQTTQAPEADDQTLAGLPTGRVCPTCSADNPVTAMSCIVCGAALSGPLKYEVVGSVMPLVEINLEPGQKVYAETHALGWMTDTVTMQTVVQGSPWSMLGRAVSGMTPLVTQFSATAQPGVVAFTSRVPGEILAVEVSREKEYVLQSGSFLAAQESVSVGAFFNQNLGAALFGGEGFILQKLHGRGIVFVKIDGEVAQYELVDGQVLLVDPGSVAFFESSVRFSIRRVPGVANVLFGQGLFLAELRGPGNVWLQTMPFAKLVGAIAARLAESGVKIAGAGSAASGLGGALGEGVGAVLGNLTGG